MVFLDRALDDPEEKLGSAASSDNPAYSDGMHRHIRYDAGELILPSCRTRQSIAAEIRQEALALSAKQAA
jgi:hypothetical protein